MNNKFILKISQEKSASKQTFISGTIILSWNWIFQQERCLQCQYFPFLNSQSDNGSILSILTFVRNLDKAKEFLSISCLILCQEYIDWIFTIRRIKCVDCLNLRLNYYNSLIRTKGSWLICIWEVEYYCIYGW